jgi:type II secretory pathway pseudopilin PulG
MQFIKDITFMYLEGQGCSGPKHVSSRPHTRFDDDGFTMVVLLVVMAIMAVGMTAMLPTWRQQAIREKEEELIFRGNQYARALVLYSRKNNNLLPPNIDVLYDGKYLRKKWKDPITDADFGLLPAGQPANAGRGNPQGPVTPGGGRSGGPAQPAQPTPGGRGTGAGGSSAFGGQQVIGSIQGVYSTSTDTSIRVYQNQQRYIDWQFTIQTALPLMGGARGGGAGMPARQGGPGATNPRGGGDGSSGFGSSGFGTPGGGPARGGGAGRGQPAGPRGGGTPQLPTGRGGRGGG